MSEAVSSACDLLGLDPLFVANEGVMVIILPEKMPKQPCGLSVKIRSDDTPKSSVELPTAERVK